MHSFVVKTVFVIVLLFGWILPQTGAVFPIELIRVVFVLPSTINIISSRMAYFILGLTLKVFVIAAWIGLPRIPQRPGVRSLETQDTLFPFESSPFHQPSISQPEMEAFLDKIAELDEEMCLRRLICHLETLPEDQRSWIQKILLKVLWMSSTPSWNYSSISSPRRHFINAAYFAKTTKCSQCCDFLYKTCPAETETLLLTF